MYNDTKVCISDIDNTVKKIEDLLVTLETEIYKTVQNLANDTEAWESKYQKVFENMQYLFSLNIYEIQVNNH